MKDEFYPLIEKLTNAKKVTDSTLTRKELNLYRAAGLTFMTSNNTEVIVIPPKDKFDIDNPGKSIDTTKMIEELEYLIGFIEKLIKKISNKDFMDKAPEKVIQMEYKKINDSISKVRIIRETLDFIYNISEKEELIEFIKSSINYNDKQKELLINEIEFADNYLFKNIKEYVEGSSEINI